MTIAILALVAFGLVAMFAVDPGTVPIDPEDKAGPLLVDRLIECRAKSQHILDTADAEKRDPNEGEMAELAELGDEFDSLKAQKEQRERLEGQAAFLDASPGPKVPRDQPRTTTEFEDTVNATTEAPQKRAKVAAQPRSRDAGRGGYRSFGEFANSVRHAHTPGGFVDNRLHEMRAPTTIGSEGSGPDGGFAVPLDFKNEILVKVTSEETLLGLTDQTPVSGNQLTLPVDETTDWQTSGGILANWEGENTQLTQSKPSLNEITIKAHKLTALVPMTDELLEDTSAMDAYLRKKAPAKLNFKLDLAILQGSGAGQPLGLLNAPGTKSVAKVSAQASDTVNFTNVQEMWNGMYAGYRTDKAVWIINQDVEPQLQNMVIAGTSSDLPVWMPAGGISGKPFNTLYGHRIIVTQACETLGDFGDIIFAAMPEYMTVVKSGGIRAESSIHLWFDYGTTAFRFIMRVGGQPALSSTIAARDGSATYSAFVALAERT